MSSIVYAHDLDLGTECTLASLWVVPDLEKAVSMQEDRAVMQTDTNRPENGLRETWWDFKKDKFEVLQRT